MWQVPNKYPMCLLGEAHSCFFPAASTYIPMPMNPTAHSPLKLSRLRSWSKLYHCSVEELKSRAMEVMGQGSR